MTRAELKQMIRAMVPSATKAKVPDTLLNTLVNKGVREVNSTGKLLRAEKYFDAEEGVRTYDMSAILSDFALIGDGGVWHNKGTVASPYYQQMFSVDRNYLNKWYKGWVNSSNGNPTQYFIEVNNIVLDQKPSETLTDGLWMPDYVKKPVDMTNDNHYPFSGSTIEYAFFEPLDDAIIAYVRWMLKHSVAADAKGIATQSEYQNLLGTQLKMVKRRPDYKSNKRNFRMRGR